MHSSLKFFVMYNRPRYLQTTQLRVLHELLRGSFDAPTYSSGYSSSPARYIIVHSIILWWVNVPPSFIFHLRLILHQLSHAVAFFGFFVPYFDRDVALFPTPPYDCEYISIDSRRDAYFPFLSIFIWLPRCTLDQSGPLPSLSKKNKSTHQISRSSDQMISHTRTILTPPSSNQYHTMLLHIMSFARNITRNHSPCTQSNSGRFTFCRVRFLWFGDSDFQCYALQCWSLDCWQSRGNGFTHGLRSTTAATDLVVCCSVGGGWGECPRWGDCDWFELIRDRLCGGARGRDWGCWPYRRH